MVSTNFQNNVKSLFNNKVFTQNPIFKLVNVDVRLGETYALRNISLEVNIGEIVFLTGQSGAGKTTFLNILGGNIHPTQGRFFEMGENNFKSQVFQDLRLIERMNGYENLRLAFDPSLYHHKHEFDSDLSELAKIFGIQNKLKMKIFDANGGLKQKIAIIRALLSRPKVFLADEPTSSLDYENAKRLFDLLNIYNQKQQMTIVWASHNRDLVQKFSGRVIHLEKGRLIHSGHACFI